MRPPSNCLSFTFQLFFSIVVSVKAYAKINLGLRILRKRDDGYHDIETVFHRVNVYDDLTFGPSRNVSLVCSNAQVPTDESNLCVQAALLLQDYRNVREGACISLTKNIPVGAGLGGGSSDAAATLLGLARFWGLDVTRKDMFSLARTLGSDVPYFLNNGTAYATGRGDVLEYFDFDCPYWIVIVYPNLHVSTAWAYRNFRISGDVPRDTLKEILLASIANLQTLNSLVKNDFEPLVLQQYEAIALTKQKLSDAGAEFVQMTGSGSSVFGFFSDERLSQIAAFELGKQYQLFVTPPHFMATG